MAHRGRPPLYATRPEWGLTLGPEVAEMCAIAGFPPDPEQEDILDAVFARNSAGLSAAFEVCVVAPRQALKTGAFKQCAIGWLYVTDETLVLWSAHEYDTAKEAHRDLAALIESTPVLSRRLARNGIKWGNGDEGIELAGGPRLKFKARTKGGGRGLTGNKVVLDEAYALTADHMGALLPTLASVPDPQVVYGSSAGMRDSLVLHALRRRGIVGADRLAYCEWGDSNPHEGCEQPGCEHELGARGCVLDDPERWAAVNPTYGRRATYETIKAMRDAMPPEQFAREFLVWWDEPDEKSEDDLSDEDWAATLEPDCAPAAPLILGADVAPHGRWASIVACGLWRGVPALEVVERGRGTDWLVARLVELWDKHKPAGIVVDPSGPIGQMLPAFEKAGLQVRLLDGKDSVRACGLLVTSVVEKALVHRDDEHHFAAAVTGARRRAVGDAWKWSRKDSSVDISPLVAATAAHWLALSEARVDYDISKSIF